MFSVQAEAAEEAEVFMVEVEVVQVVVRAEAEVVRQCYT